MTTYFAGSIIAKNLVERIQQFGIDPMPLAKDLGLTENVLNDPFGWVKANQVMRLMEGLEELSGKPDIGFQMAARPYKPHHWGVAGYVLQSAPSMKVLMDITLALTNGERGDSHLVGGYDWKENWGSFFLRNVEDYWPSMPSYMEFWLGETFQIFQHYMGRELTPLEVSFSHPLQGDLAAYEAFYHCPVLFNQQMTAITFPAEWANMEGAECDDNLHQTLLKFIDYHTNIHVADFPFSNLVQIELERLISEKQIPTLNSLSFRMGESPRNVQRNLQKEGCTFSTIWEEVRKNHALLSVQNPFIHMDEISYSLGYSDTSAFYHAFKRWTGMTPKEYRSRNTDPYIRNLPSA